jgi:lipid-A-disaccharide synthase
MTLLPDEGRYFEKYGLRCDFVGHPVVERTSGLSLDPAGLRERYGIPAGQRVVCVLPGSRRSELKRLLPVFRRAMDTMLRRHDEMCFVVPTLGTLEERVREGFEGLPVRVVAGGDDKYNAFATSDMAIAASGTVSLELAALRVPHLVAYKFSPLTDILVKMVVRTPFANLINILADRRIIPEFMLRDCRPAPIARCAGELLDSPAVATTMAEQASEILARLRPGDITPSRRAAQIVLEAATTNR